MLSSLACLGLYLWPRSWAMEVELDVLHYIKFKLLMEIVCACSWWGPPGGQKCDLIWHYTWGWECNVSTKLQPVASLCLCHPLHHNHTSNAMWPEHWLPNPIPVCCTLATTANKGWTEHWYYRVAIVEVLTAPGDIPHVYFLCEMWGNTRCVNVVELLWQ